MIYSYVINSQKHFTRWGGGNSGAATKSEVPWGKKNTSRRQNRIRTKFTRARTHTKLHYSHWIIQSHMLETWTKISAHPLKHYPYPILSHRLILQYHSRQLVTIISNPISKHRTPPHQLVYSGAATRITRKITPRSKQYDTPTAWLSKSKTSKVLSQSIANYHTKKETNFFTQLVQFYNFNFH